MKNFKIILLAFMFFSAVAFAQTITITNPSAGGTWCKGQTYTIQWTKSGTLHAKVKIRLYDTAGTVKILNISDDTDNDGNLNWTIPGSLTAGNYRIRVKTLDNAVYDDSDIFTIADCTVPTITVDDPHRGDNWLKTQTYAIRWTRSGTLHAKVKIRLYNTAGTVKILNITDETDNDGNFSWKIPGSLTPADYLVRVKTLDNAVFDDSTVFKISDPVQAVPDFELTGLITPQGYGGNLHSISVKLKNNGDTYEGPLSFRIIGLDKLSGGSFTLDQKKTFTMKIARGEIVTKRLLGKVDWPAEVCKITFGAVVDTERKITESNERNNVIERTRYKGELLGKKYCRIRIIPKILKIGRAALRPVPEGGSIVLAHDKVDLFLTFRNYCSETKVLEFSIVYDWTTFTRDGANKVIWNSRITMKPCGVKPLRITGLRIPKKREFKVLALRSHHARGYDIIYQIKVRVDY